MTARIAALLALTISLFGAAPASAAGPATPPPWEDLNVPGTMSGFLQALELRGEAITTERFLPEVIRAISIPSRRVKGIAYLEALEEFARVYNQAGGPLNLRALQQNGDARRRVRDVFDLLGLRVTQRRNQAPSVSFTNDERASAMRDAIGAAGVNMAALDRRLNAGEDVALVLSKFAVPLPISHGWWTLAANTDLNLLAILRNDRLACLVYGMATVDRKTLEYFRTRPKQIGSSIGDHVETFAASGGAIRIWNESIDVPGGREAIPFWESLVHEPVTRPETFIQVLLSEDHGRLAYFYAAVDAIDPPHQRFVLGSWKVENNLRTEAKEVYDRFRLGGARWNPKLHPFTRPEPDPATLLALVAVDAEGRPSGPTWFYFWSKLFSDRTLPDKPGRELKPEPGVVDLPFLLDALYGDGVDVFESKPRLFAFLFAQRAFVNATEMSAPDMLLALRGFRRFPMLHLTLERMGLTDPAIYAAATRRAASFQTINDPEEASAALSQFQGALSLIEHGTRRRRLSFDRASALITSLVGLPLENDRRYGSIVAVWLERELVPAVAARVPQSQSATIEETVLAGLAGLRVLIDPETDTVPGPRLRWEGLDYRVNPAPGLLERLKKIRSTQRLNSIDLVLKVLALRGALTARATVEDVASLANVARTLQDTVEEPALPPWLADRKRLTVKDAFADVREILRGIKKPNQVKNATRAVPVLDELLDRLTADLLRGLAYALAIPDQETPLLAGGDVSYRHDFGLGAQDRDAREAAAWGGPESQNNAAWPRVRGALLALDVGMSELALRRVVGLRPPTHIPMWPIEGRLALAQYVSFFEPISLDAADIDRIARGIATGRGRVARLTSSSADLDAAMKRAGVSPLRRQMIEWTLENDASRVSRQFSMEELLRLGLDSDVVRFDQWGAPAFALSGCLCLRLSPAVDFTYFGGDLDEAAFLGDRSADLLLRVTEVVAAYKVPPAVIGDILPNVLQMIIDEAPLNRADDWISFARYTAAIDAVTIEDFISTVTVGRSMLPATSDAP